MASQGRSTRDNLSCTDYCTVGGKEAVKLPAAFGVVTLNGKLNGENLKKWLEKNFHAGTEGSITALINKQKDLRNFFSQDSAVENNKPGSIKWCESKCTAAGGFLSKIKGRQEKVNTFLNAQQGLFTAALKIYESHKQALLKGVSVSKKQEEPVRQIEEKSTGKTSARSHAMGPSNDVLLTHDSAYTSKKEAINTPPQDLESKMNRNDTLSHVSEPLSEHAEEGAPSEPVNLESNVHAPVEDAAVEHLSKPAEESAPTSQKKTNKSSYRAPGDRDGYRREDVLPVVDLES